MENIDTLECQGDIIGLFDKTGTQVVSYLYDSWGKLISINDKDGNDITNNTASVGYKNPYRYRGYRYDTETGLYYLQSRYYNPEWGRFINADSLGGSIGELLSHNVFAYCQNDPVNYQDPSGCVRVEHWDDYSVSSTQIIYASKEAALAAEPSVGKVLKTVGMVYGVAAVGAVGSVAVEAVPSIGTVVKGIAAKKAAKNVGNFVVKNKHLMSSNNKKWAKFASDNMDEIRLMIQEGLLSPDRQFVKNNWKSWQVITDLGRAIGTKGQTKIRTIVDWRGRIWTSFPTR